MSTVTTFADLTYTRPDIDHLRAQMESLVAAFAAQPSAESTIDLVRHWNVMRTNVSTMQSLAEVKFTQNVKDEDAKREKQFLDEFGPTITELFMLVQKEVLASPHLDAIKEAFGELFVIRLEESDKVFRPEIKDLLVEEAELCTKYNDITASAKIEVDGKTYNLSTIGTLAISLDRETRKKAVTAVYDFLASHQAEIESIYDRLVKLRDEKARRLGYNDYIEFRYIEFGRHDYNRNDVAVFRDQVIAHVVPLVGAFRAAQAKRLGIDNVRIYDEKLHFADGNPVANGDHDWIVDKARTMYAELSPETHEFFELMLQGGLMDLKSRDNKATGGYCTSFAEFGLPFIFANFNQTTHDIEVLTHEAGHAFQCYRSRAYEQPEYRWPTMEACEIHSMGMEFLTWPWMGSFFGEQLDKFRFYHLQGALLFLPYACAVDHFQHWVYENPNATPAERNATWTEMESVYMPWRDTSDIAHAATGTQWQLQRHIIESPFYYIDYALAQTCALQFWQASQVDRAKAFSDYLRICDIGGSQSFVQIVRSGNLRSPFEAGCLDSIVSDVKQWLDREYPQYL